MRLLLKKDWEVIDGSKDTPAIIGKGEHQIERIPNPMGFQVPWLVLEGTKVGASEPSWRQWRNGDLACNPLAPNFGRPIDWGDFEVVILDDDTPVEGYVIVNADGQTLDRNVWWSTNKNPQKGYVHTLDSVEILRIASQSWQVKPVSLYVATYFEGKITVGQMLTF